jgi:hypothetical protein
MKISIPIFFHFFLILGSAMAADEASLSSVIKSAMPNTLGVIASGDTTVVNLESREPLKTQNQAIDNGLGEASKVFGSFSLNRLTKFDTSGTHFLLRWVPAFTFAYHQLQFESPSAFLSQTDFRMFRTSLGYGPELDLVTQVGTFYLSLSPGLAYSWLSWSSPVSGGALNAPNLNLTAGAGFQTYFTKSWAIRIFANQVFEDKELWKEALESSQGFEVPVTNVYNLNVGTSLCYTFN